MSSEKKPEPSFEQDLEKLEQIVNALEEGKLPLDEALRRFESGVGLVRRCEKTLQQAERKIEKLVQGMDGELEAQPFDAEAEEAAGTKGKSTPEPVQRATPNAPPDDGPPPDYDRSEPYSDDDDEDDVGELF